MSYVTLACMLQKGEGKGLRSGGSILHSPVTCEDDSEIVNLLDKCHHVKSMF